MAAETTQQHVTTQALDGLKTELSDCVKRQTGFFNIIQNHASNLDFAYREAKENLFFYLIPCAVIPILFVVAYSVNYLINGRIIIHEPLHLIPYSIMYGFAILYVGLQKIKKDRAFFQLAWLDKNLREIGYRVSIINKDQISEFIKISNLNDERHIGFKFNFKLKSYYLENGEFRK